MSKKKRGFYILVDTIGSQFFEQHKNAAVLVENWDIYATCYVTDNDIIMDKCKLP